MTWVVIELQLGKSMDKMSMVHRKEDSGSDILDEECNSRRIVEGIAQTTCHVIEPVKINKSVAVCISLC